MYTIHTYIHIHGIPRAKYKPKAEIIPAHEFSRTTIIYIYIVREREREKRENSIRIILSLKKWLRCTAFVTEIRLSDPKITWSSGIKSAPGAHACSSCYHLHRPLSRAAIQSLRWHHHSVWCVRMHTIHIIHSRICSVCKHTYLHTHTRTHAHPHPHTSSTVCQTPSQMESIYIRDTNVCVCVSVCVRLSLSLSLLS
jgi:hypothetical protein